jgi:hypothetical protein
MEIQWNKFVSLAAWIFACRATLLCKRPFVERKFESCYCQKKEKRSESSRFTYLISRAQGRRVAGLIPWLAARIVVAIAGVAQKAWRIPIKDRGTVFFLCEIPHESG